MGQEKDIKDTRNGKELIMLSLFIDSMNVYGKKIPKNLKL